MELINNYYLKSLQIFDNFDPKLSGIFFSLFIHLLILLIAIGLPNFFSQKKISLPNIIPIEIINVTETTNIDMNKNIKDNLETNEKKFIEQKKFNSSENTEIKKINLEENEKKLKQVVVEEKKVNKNIVKESMVIKEKKSPEIKIEKKNFIEDNIETIKTKKIKPKIKPKIVENKNNNNLDTLLEQKIEDKKKIDLTKKIEPKPEVKPEPDFNIATMLKDLRNEKTISNNENKQGETEKKITDSDSKENNDNLILSISEIDLLRQQLSSCWNAPAGAVIKKGMKVRISAKVERNRRVIGESVQIIDTNIPESNPFYGPITESAMRTLLKPECTPLKLPEDKYDLWKDLTITFDYSIMKGYS